MKRKKSKIESCFSLNQHRRRLGAAKVVQTSVDLAALKASILKAGETTQTRGSVKDLETHLDNLRIEFSGQSELLSHHAKLIVLIRRGFKEKETYRAFRELWQSEQDFLCQHLNIRWLISATDTMADHDPAPQTRTTAKMVSLLTNLVKMNDSERYVCSSTGNAPVPERIEHLQDHMVPLFEGMSCFTVGTDDTLRNMYWRLEPFFQEGPAGAILKTVWDRFQTEDTVFARMRALHHRDRTAWWTDEG